MKKIFIILFCAVAFVAMAQAQQWVGLTKNVPTEPEITVIRSNNQQVSFTVGVSGFYADPKTEGGIAYQRLAIPNCGVAGTTGEPEIPVIGKSIAVPVCSSISYSVTVTASQTLQGYRVYPVPTLQPDSAGMLQEVFTLNPSAYLQNSFTPNARYVIAETGALREQHYVTLEINPIRFNPATGQLEVVTQMEITLVFNNPTTAVNANTGIFNKVATSAFINYEDSGMSALVNDRAFEKSGFVPGTITWITLTDTAQACTIPADYVIITVPDFFTPNNPNSQLQRLAEHRAWYNGYDVAILNVADILSDVVGFYYEGIPSNQNPNSIQWKNSKLEQRLRTCIRRIYEGAHAQHTGDGHLGFVLLVGDDDANIAVSIPGARSHGVAYDNMPNNPDCLYFSDYYYSCITKTNGEYDDNGDLYIGRFSVQTPTQLFNMVEKTINFETNFSDMSWRKTTGTTIAGTLGANYWTGYLNFVNPIIAEAGFSHSIVNSWTNGGVIREGTLAYLNTGAAYTHYMGNGTSSYGFAPTDWWDNLVKDTFALRLHNDYRASFITAIYCLSASFVNHYCLAEFLTTYSPNRGAVGYIGNSRAIEMSGGTNLSFQECFPKFLFGQPHISIAGELLRTSKMAALPHLEQNKYAFNLFGDPALNILAEPGECPKYLTETHTISNGDSLKVYSGCDLHFRENGKLIIEEGGRFIVEDGARIFGDLCQMDTVIHIKGGEVNIGENVIFQNLKGGILLENTPSGNVQSLYSYVTGKEYNLRNVTFNNTPLKHQYTLLNISDCTFNPDSHLTTSTSISNIENCTFSSATLTLNNALVPKRNMHPSTVSKCYFENSENLNINALQINNSNAFMLEDNEITGYETGISLNASGVTLSPISDICRIDNNLITNCFTGVELYSSAAHFRSNTITNHANGVRLMNNSYTFINANQIIQDCDAIEVYASANSLPTVFRDNQIIDEDNLGNKFDDPLFYWDIIYNNNNGVANDISYNCWGDNFDPDDDIYPTEALIWSPVQCPKRSGSPISNIEALYQTGLTYFAEEDYMNAETAFKDLITTSPNSPFAIAALHELFALEQFLNNDYAALNSYYSTFTPNDSALFNVAEFLATRCNIQERNWQPAIDWYENRIENPPSYQDSVFAVIDLGDIHLMMAADTLGGAKGMHHCSYRLAHVKPNSKREYEENKTTLLATLPRTTHLTPQTATPHTATKGSLGQNIPNPTTGTTTISYEVYTDGAVEIRIYNVLGQQIQTLPQGMKKTGNYQITISLANVPAGMYNYMLFVDGEKADAKKMVKQ